MGDIFENPEVLEQMTMGELEALAREEGWLVDTMRRRTHLGQGLTLREWNSTRTGFTDRLIQVHPGGGHHGPEPYWKVSSAKTGTVRIGPQFRKPE